MSKLVEFVDVKPGEIFLSNRGLDGEKQYFLKLAEQKAIHLGTFHAFSWYDQQEKVEVLGKATFDYIE